MKKIDWDDWDDEEFDKGYDEIYNSCVNEKITEIGKSYMDELIERYGLEIEDFSNK